MKHHFVEKSQISGDRLTVTGPKFHHLVNVLRVKTGARLNFFDGQSEYAGEILEITGGQIMVKILDRKAAAEKLPEVWLAQALPKAGKMDLIIREISEIGAAGIIPFVSQNCEVRLDGAGEKAERKVDHWREVAVSAAEQSGRGSILSVARPIDVKKLAAAFVEFYRVIFLWEKSRLGIKKFLRDDNNKLSDSRKILLIVGPEGSFAEEEIKKFQEFNNVSAVSLGENILRTETAGPVAVSLILYELGRLG